MDLKKKTLLLYAACKTYTDRLKIKGYKKIYHAKSRSKEDRVSILISTKERITDVRCLMTKFQNTGEEKMTEIKNSFTKI